MKKNTENKLVSLIQDIGTNVVRASLAISLGALLMGCPQPTNQPPNPGSGTEIPPGPSNIIKEVSIDISDLTYADLEQFDDLGNNLNYGMVEINITNNNNINSVDALILMKAKSIITKKGGQTLMTLPENLNYDLNFDDYITNRLSGDNTKTNFNVMDDIVKPYAILATEFDNNGINTKSFLPGLDIVTEESSRTQAFKVTGDKEINLNTSKYNLSGYNGGIIPNNNDYSKINWSDLSNTTFSTGTLLNPNNHFIRTDYSDAIKPLIFGNNFEKLNGLTSYPSLTDVKLATANLYGYGLETTLEKYYDASEDDKFIGAIDSGFDGRKGINGNIYNGDAYTNAAPNFDIRFLKHLEVGSFIENATVVGDNPYNGGDAMPAFNFVNTKFTGDLSSLMMNNVVGYGVIEVDVAPISLPEVDGKFILNSTVNNYVDFGKVIKSLDLRNLEPSQLKAIFGEDKRLQELYVKSGLLSSLSNLKNSPETTSKVIYEVDASGNTTVVATEGTPDLVKRNASTELWEVAGLERTTPALEEDRLSSSFSINPSVEPTIMDLIKEKTK